LTIQKLETHLGNGVGFLLGDNPMHRHTQLLCHGI
jgi:hypothetical protein